MGRVTVKGLTMAVTAHRLAGAEEQCGFGVLQGGHQPATSNGGAGGAGLRSPTGVWLAASSLGGVFPGLLPTASIFAVRSYNTVCCFCSAAYNTSAPSQSWIPYQVSKIAIPDDWARFNRRIHVPRAREGNTQELHLTPRLSEESVYRARGYSLASNTFI